MRRRVRLAIASLVSVVLSIGLIIFHPPSASADIIPGTHTCVASQPLDGYRGVVCVDVDVNRSTSRVHARSQALCQSVSTGNTVQCAGIHLSQFVMNLDNNSNTATNVAWCGRDAIPMHNPPCPSTGRLEYLSEGAAAHCGHVYRVVAQAAFHVPGTGRVINAISAFQDWIFPC